MAGPPSNYRDEIMSSIQDWLGRVDIGPGIPETEMIPFAQPEIERSRTKFPIVPIPNAQAGDVPKNAEIPNNYDRLFHQPTVDLQTDNKVGIMDYIMQSMGLRKPGMDI